MELASFESSGKAGKKVSVDDAIFGTSVNASVVHAVVRWQRAKRRAGTHSTLNRSAMKGGGRKPFKQKGTGRARAGSRNSPLWRGGAVIFGPTPRSYEHALPRKVRRQALYGVLSDRASSDAIVVVKSIELSEPKTKEFVSLLDNLKLMEKGRVKNKVVFIYSKEEEQAQRAARNIEGVRCLRVEGVNVYDLLRSKQILISEATLQRLQGQLGSQE